MMATMPDSRYWVQHYPKAFGLVGKEILLGTPTRSNNLESGRGSRLKCYWVPNTIGSGYKLDLATLDRMVKQCLIAFFY